MTTHKNEDRQEITMKAFWLKIDGFWLTIYKHLISGNFVNALKRMPSLCFAANRIKRNSLNPSLFLPVLSGTLLCSHHNIHFSIGTSTAVSTVSESVI